MNDATNRWETAVPPRLPRTRVVTSEDIPTLVRWIEAGRRDGVFRGEPSLDPASLLKYHDEISQSGWEYACFIVEDGGIAVGYLDYRYRGPVGEILGLYLEEPARGKKFGRHLLRWAIAALREHGCREVLGDVYADNVVSLRACRSVGMKPGARPDRLEDGKLVRVLGRRLRQWRRFSPPDPLYRQLQGENLFLHHMALAEALTDEIRLLPEVELVIGMGSLARQFGDQWSDLDLGVLGHNLRPEQLWRGERWLAGVSVDLFHVDLALAPPSRWDLGRREAFQESIVLFCRDAALPRHLRRYMRLRRRERLNRVRDLLFRLGWVGFAPRAWFGQTRHGYHWELPPDVWLQRGCLSAAHATVDQAYDMVLHLLYLVNGRHVPDPKWRRFRVPGLDWLPPNFSALRNQAETSDRDESGYTRRAEAVLELVEGTVQHLEQQPEFEGDWYTPHLDFCPDYNPKR